jgi:hypothetical protein
VSKNIAREVEGAAIGQLKLFYPNISTGSRDGNSTARISDSG